MEEKKEYTEPFLEIIDLSDCDVIVASNPKNGGLDNGNIDWGDMHWF